MQEQKSYHPYTHIALPLSVPFRDGLLIFVCSSLTSIVGGVLLTGR